MSNKNIEQLVGYKTKDEKDEELKELYRKIYYALTLESLKIKDEIKNTHDMLEFIDKINFVDYLKLREGYGYTCLRSHCTSKMTNANFYKYNNKWFYKCFVCFDSKPIPQSKLIVDIIQSQNKDKNYLEIMDMLKSILMLEYNYKYYSLVQNIIKNNLELLNNVSLDTPLGKLLSKRKLLEFYEDFLGVAKIYALQQEKENDSIAFYASRQFLKDYFNIVLNKKANNSILQKIDILNALGLLNKIDAKDLDNRRMNDVINYQAKKRYTTQKNYLKQVNCFSLRALNEEDIKEAQRVAQIIIENKITVLTTTHLELIKMPVLINDNNDIMDIIKNIKGDVIKNKYIVLEDVSELSNANSIILNDSLDKNNLMIVKGTKKNIAKYNITDERVNLDTKLIVEKIKDQNEELLEMAIKNIRNVVNEKGYVLTNELINVMFDDKKIYIKVNNKRTVLGKKHKEAFIKNNLSKILIELDLKSVRINKENREKYMISENYKSQETIIIKK